MDFDEAALQAVGIRCPASKITCTKGFITDLASVPRAIWWLISPWDIARAAIIHDLLYKRIRQYRAKDDNLVEYQDVDELYQGVDKFTNNYKAAKKAADKVFLMAMKDAEPSIPKWKMYAAYYAVVLCGRWSIIPREGD